MMLALCPAVTFARPCSSAHRNANSVTRSAPESLISLTEMPLSGRTVRPVVSWM